jgi:hypothetical protein
MTDVEQPKQTLKKFFADQLTDSKKTYRLHGMHRDCIFIRGTLCENFFIKLHKRIKDVNAWYSISPHDDMYMLVTFYNAKK